MSGGVIVGGVGSQRRRDRSGARPVRLVLGASLSWTLALTPAAVGAVLDGLEGVAVPWPLLVGLAVVGVGAGTPIAWDHLRYLPRIPDRGLPPSRPAYRGQPRLQPQATEVVDHLQAGRSPVVVRQGPDQDVREVAQMAAHTGSRAWDGGPVVVKARGGRTLRGRHVAKALHTQYHQLVGRKLLHEVVRAGVRARPDQDRDRELELLLLVDGVGRGRQVPLELLDPFPFVVVAVTGRVDALAGFTSVVVRPDPPPPTGLPALLVGAGNGPEDQVEWDAAEDLVRLCARHQPLVEVLRDRLVAAAKVRDAPVAVAELLTALDRLLVAPPGRTPPAGDVLVGRLGPRPDLARELARKDPSLGGRSRGARRLYPRLAVGLGVDAEAPRAALHPRRQATTLLDVGAVAALVGRRRGRLARRRVDRRLWALVAAGLVSAQPRPTGADSPLVYQVNEACTDLAWLHLRALPRRARRRAVRRLVAYEANRPGDLLDADADRVGAVRGLFEVAPGRSRGWFDLAVLLCAWYDSDDDLAAWRQVAQRVLDRAGLRGPDRLARLVAPRRAAWAAWALNQLGVLHRRQADRLVGDGPGRVGRERAELLERATRLLARSQVLGGARRAAQPLANLGRVHLDQGKVDEAIACLERARDQHDRRAGGLWARAWRERSRHQLALSQVALGVAYRRRAASLDPPGGAGAGAHGDRDQSTPAQQAAVDARRAAATQLRSAVDILATVAPGGRRDRPAHLSALLNLVEVNDELENGPGAAGARMGFERATGELSPRERAVARRLMGPEDTWPSAAG